MPGFIGVAARRRGISSSGRISECAQRRASLQLEVEISQATGAKLQPANSSAEDEATPEELLLHASEPFVQRCTAWLQKKRRTARDLKESSTILMTATQQVTEAPNWALFMWVNSCFPYETEEFKAEWAIAEQLQQVIDAAMKKTRTSSSKERNEAEQKSASTGTTEALLILLLQSFQFLLLCSALISLMIGRSLTPEHLCVTFESTEEAGLGMLDYLTVVENAALFSYAVLQTKLAGREWEGIRFITSLHYRPLANTTIFIAALLEMFCSMLFAICLYLIIVDSPGVLDVLFNCTALSFVLELDNIVIHLMPRRAAHVSHIIAKKLRLEDATMTDYALFLCAPRDTWAPYGFHRGTWAWTRNQLGKVLWFATFLAYVAHSIGYSALLRCYHFEDVTSNTTHAS